MISRIRVSSIGSLGPECDAAARRLRLAVDVGTMEFRQCFCSKNSILSPFHEADRHCAMPVIALHRAGNATCLFGLSPKSLPAAFRMP
jgi:hypothetical protein